MLKKTMPKTGDKVMVLKKRNHNLQEIPTGLIGTITIITNDPCETNMILVEFDECVDGHQGSRYNEYGAKKLHPYMDDNCWWFPSKRWYDHFEIFNELSVELI